MEGMWKQLNKRRGKSGRKRNEGSIWGDEPVKGVGDGELGGDGQV